MRGRERLVRGRWWGLEDGVGLGIGVGGFENVNQELKVLLKEHKGIMYNFKNNKNNKTSKCGAQRGGRFDPKPSQSGEKDKQI